MKESGRHAYAHCGAVIGGAHPAGRAFQSPVFVHATRVGTRAARLLPRDERILYHTKQIGDVTYMLVGSRPGKVEVFRNRLHNIVRHLLD